MSQIARRLVHTATIWYIMLVSRYQNTELDKYLFLFLQVVPTYERKTMVGVLASQRIRAGSHHVGQSLAQVNPVSHDRRRTRTERQTNPIPYSSKYFGNKAHIDQNEKLVLFGVTHVCAVDVYSGMIVGFATLPVNSCVRASTGE